MTYSSVPLKDLTEEEREEMVERSLRRRQLDHENSRPMNPDRDFSWENTNFEGYEND
jgi:hypothetical protein